MITVTLSHNPVTKLLLRAIFPALLGASALAGTYQTVAHNAFDIYSLPDTANPRTYGCTASSTIFDTWTKVDSSNVSDITFQGGLGVEVVYVPTSPLDKPAPGVQLTLAVSYATNTTAGALAQILDSSGAVITSTSTNGVFASLGTVTVNWSSLWTENPDGTYSMDVYWQALGVRSSNALSSSLANSTVRYTLTSLTSTQ